jgi:hypothetical protein
VSVQNIYFLFLMKCGRKGEERSYYTNFRPATGRIKMLNSTDRICFLETQLTKIIICIGVGQMLVVAGIVTALPALLYSNGVVVTMVATGALVLGGLRLRSQGEQRSADIPAD